jgi:hypothetical protein
MRSDEGSQMVCYGQYGSLHTRNVHHSGVGGQIRENFDRRFRGDSNDYNVGYRFEDGVQRVGVGRCESPILRNSEHIGVSVVTDDGPSRLRKADGDRPADQPKTDDSSTFHEAHNRSMTIQ